MWFACGVHHVMAHIAFNLRGNTSWLAVYSDGPESDGPPPPTAPESDEMSTFSLVKCAECLLLPTTRVLLGMRRAAARECRGLLLSMRAASTGAAGAGACVRRGRACGEGQLFVNLRADLPLTLEMC